MLTGFGNIEVCFGYEKETRPNNKKTLKRKHIFHKNSFIFDALAGCGRTRLVGVLMGDFGHDRVGRVDLFGGNEAADLGAAVRTWGREALPAPVPA